MQIAKILALSAVAAASALPEENLLRGGDGGAIGPVKGGGGGSVGGTVQGGGHGSVGGPIGGGGSGRVESSALVGCFSYHLGPYSGATCYTDYGPTATPAPVQAPSAPAGGQSVSAVVKRHEARAVDAKKPKHPKPTHSVHHAAEVQARAVDAKKPKPTHSIHHAAEFQARAVDVKHPKHPKPTHSIHHAAEVQARAVDAKKPKPTHSIHHAAEFQARAVEH